MSRTKSGVQAEGQSPPFSNPPSPGRLLGRTTRGPQLTAMKSLANVPYLLPSHPQWAPPPPKPGQITVPAVQG
jgi:hypothetical protein